MLLLLTFSVLIWISGLLGQSESNCPPKLPDAECKFIKVPLDHASGSCGTKIEFHYALRKPKVTGYVTRKALVFLSGGPGFGNIDFVSDFYSNPVLPDTLRQPILIIDYRGTGRSNVLKCSLQETFPWFPTVRQGGNCIQEVGKNSIYYSSQSIARDLELLRTSLGFEQLDLIAISWGTQVLQWYATLFPKKINVAVMDSPITFAGDTFGLRRHRALSRIYESKGFDTNVLKHDLKVTLTLIRGNSWIQRKLSIRPWFLNELFLLGLDVFPPAAGLAATGNFSVLQKLGATSLAPPTYPILQRSFAADIIIRCNDGVHFAPWRLEDTTRTRIIKLFRNLQTTVPQFSFYPFKREEAYVRQLDPCAGFPYRQIVPVKLKNPEGVNILTLVGEYDPITPLENLDGLFSKYLKNAFTVKNNAHITISNSCITEVVIKFVATGVIEPSECMETIS